MNTYILHYYGEETVLRYSFPSLTFNFLLCNYVIATGEEASLSLLPSFPMVTDYEKATLFSFENYNSRTSSCRPFQSQNAANPTILTGKGVLIGIIDSGIDYLHPDFIDENGTSRIIALWDQTLSQTYDQTLITQAIHADSALQKELVPSVDLSGHGTFVAGSAAGNGRASNGVLTGMAPEAKLLVVKLAPEAGGLYPNSAKLMQAVDFCTRRAMLLQQPLVINLSYGNSIGPHTGHTLFEAYLNDISHLWKCALVVGTGNEGNAAGHASVKLLENTQETIEFSVDSYVPSLLIDLWKSPLDSFRVELISPDLKHDSASISYRPLSPHSMYEEIALLIKPKEGYVTPGIWKLQFTTTNIKNGVVELWMPSEGTRGSGARFLTPDTDFTLTIPSTAENVISVGAYDAYLNAPAAFSGRGLHNTSYYPSCTKPDLVAPGVGIRSCAPQGGYAILSGTSMATPFVSGAAACLMQWGIVEENDVLLYGDALKSALHAGAIPLLGAPEVPNPVTGWGALCLRASLSYLLSRTSE